MQALFCLFTEVIELCVAEPLFFVRSVGDAKKKLPARWCCRLGGALRYYYYYIIRVSRYFNRVLAKVGNELV